MKKILFITFAILTLFSCKQDEQPYYGYAVFENNKNQSRVLVDQTEGSATVQLKTDRSSGNVTPEEGSEWCSGTVKDGTLTLQYAANPENKTRVGILKITLGLHQLKLQVVQRTTGTNHIEILNPNEGNPMRWSATCSDFQPGEGGGTGVNAIFDDSQTTFWHSSYSPSVPLPHWIVVDLKEEMNINQVRMAWRKSGANIYIHVRKVEILVSNDGVNFSPTGGIIFREPVDGKMTSPNYAPYTDCEFPTVKARYVKMNMTESNDKGGVCHVSIFKVFMP